MAGFLDRFRKNVVSSVCKDRAGDLKIKDIDDKIALGVLLLCVTGAVADADDKFLPKEGEKIKEVLLSRLKISEQDFPIVLTAIRQAAIEKIDFYQYAHGANKSLSYAAKVSIIENLFRIACVDKNLNKNEFEVIRKLSSLFHVANKDFIDVKIKAEKESGLDVAGF